MVEPIILAKQPNDVTKEEVTEQLVADEISYLFSKINWAESWLDAKAIQVMNNLNRHIKWAVENAK